MLNICAGFGGIGTCLLRFVPRTYLFTCFDMAKCISWNVHNSHHTQDFVEQSWLLRVRGVFPAFPFRVSNHADITKWQRRKFVFRRFGIQFGPCAASRAGPFRYRSYRQKSKRFRWWSSVILQLSNWKLTGEGQEKDLAQAMNTAFNTFKKSKNETVKAQIAEFDPKAEESKVR